MSTRMPQPAESSDSTAKLMLEAFAKASAELEKSVADFTEQLLSFNEALQKSLDEEVCLISARLEGCIKDNLDVLGHNKHVLLKRLVEAEREELSALSDVGKDVRGKLSAHALQAESQLKSFMKDQIAALKDYLQQPEGQIKTKALAAAEALKDSHQQLTADTSKKNDEVRQCLSDKVREIERQIKEESERVRQSISIAADRHQHRLSSKRDEIKGEISKQQVDATNEINTRATDGMTTLTDSETHNRESLNSVESTWKKQINEHCESFHKTLQDFSAVVKDNYERELANVSLQARREIDSLSESAHEKMESTRSELAVELREVENEYVNRFQATIRKLEAIVTEHVNDKKNSGTARQHKAEKLREQMLIYLGRWGGNLVDSVKSASQDLECDYNRATEGFHTRIETARASSIELLERESRLMQKDIDRTMKEFQRDLDELDGELGRIEKAGQDSALTVITYRKAMLDFRGE